MEVSESGKFGFENTYKYIQMMQYDLDYSHELFDIDGVKARFDIHRNHK